MDEDSILGDRLIVESSKLGHTIDYINSKNIQSLLIKSDFFCLDNLDFLVATPLVRGLFILEDNINVSAINTLRDLQVLRLSEVSNSIDLSNFPDLRVLGCTYSKFILNIDSCKHLFWVWLDKFKEVDLATLATLENMQYLNLYLTGVINLGGISLMKKLKFLRLDTARKLESLQGLEKSLTNLESIDIYNARKLTDYSQLSNVPSLKYLYLDKTGESQSIDFVKHLPNLEIVSLGFKVLDGQMDGLKSVKQVVFTDFPHYTYKMKDFNKKNE